MGTKWKSLASFSPERLKDARELAGMSQSKLADEIGLANPDTIRRWEKGEAEPSATMLIRLAGAIAYEATRRGAANSSALRFYSYYSTRRREKREGELS